MHHAAIHVTCNIILHEDNLEGLEDYLLKLDEIGVDAIIVADPYIMSLAKKIKLKIRSSCFYTTFNHEYQCDSFL